MAEILPFRAVCYNPAQVADLGKVVTQPYDKISREMQSRYYDLSPYNLVRIILGRRNPSDSLEDNVYTRAARTFQEWVREGVLRAALEPALYPYHQHYSLPGAPALRLLAQGGERSRTGGQKVRRGLIALCRLQDYAAHVVFRHEETLAAPKADRLELLKATRAHFEQIFVLYSDPEGEIERHLATCTSRAPWQQVADDYGAEHSLWRLTDPLAIEQVVTLMREKKLVIADGHHRYETALAYRDHCRRRSPAEERAEFLMMTFVRRECEGLTVLPTHRVVHGLASFVWSDFMGAAERLFQCERVPAPVSTPEGRAQFLAALEDLGRERSTLGVYAGPEKFCLLRLRREIDLARVLPELPAGLRQLDVVILHRLLLEKILGIDRQAVREEKNLRYVREAEVAVREVGAGAAQVCFLMNPTPVGAVWENALAGQVLPQKSTDFYPKLLSGPTIYWLDNPLGV